MRFSFKFEKVLVIVKSVLRCGRIWNVSGILDSGTEVADLSDYWILLILLSQHTFNSLIFHVPLGYNRFSSEPGELNDVFPCIKGTLQPRSKQARCQTIENQIIRTLPYGTTSGSEICLFRNFWSNCVWKRMEANYSLLWEKASEKTSISWTFVLFFSVVNNWSACLSQTELQLYQGRRKVLE